MSTGRFLAYGLLKNLSHYELQVPVRQPLWLVRLKNRRRGLERLAGMKPVDFTRQNFHNLLRLQFAVSR